MHATLNKLYAEYRHTVDINAKGEYFSPTCMQICRPQPSYAASDRATIVRYLFEAASQGKDLATSKGKGYYTIRPLRDAELEFGTDEQAKPAGFTAAELQQMARSHGWIGMRVDLWEDEGLDESGAKQGLLVKVQYWWAMEEGAWIQILHDIMYIGPRDGSEGTEGPILE